MLNLGDIIRDGSEHLMRRYKIITLKQRLKQLEKEQRDVARQLGHAAWQECRELVIEHDPGIAELQNERDSILETRKQQLENLNDDIVGKRFDHEERENESLEFADGLEDMITTRSKLKAKRARLEAELKQLENHNKEKEKQGEDLSEDDSQLLKDKEQQIEEVSRQQEENQQQIQQVHSSISSYRKQQQRFIDDVTLIEKQQKRIEKEANKKLAPLEKRLSELYTELGRSLSDSRPECPALSRHFSALDLVETANEAAERSLESEHKLLELLDREAVIWFYALSGISIFVLIALSWLLIWIFFF